MKQKLRAIFFLLATFFLPQIASACSVCFGGAGSNWSKGFYWGVLLLLTLPVLLISTIAGRIYCSVRLRAKRFPER